jgi:hypothetical protein
MSISMFAQTLKAQEILLHSSIWLLPEMERQGCLDFDW